MTQCVHYFTKQRQGAAAALRTLDVFALLLAAICHDVDHVGLTADFLGGTALDLLYNERSPMESHHLTTTFRILGHPKCNVLAGVAQADRKALRSSIVACVLGTDMARHAQFLTDFAAPSELPILTTSDDERELLMVGIIKAADIANVCRPFDVAMKWAVAIQSEWFGQAELCASLGRACAPFMKPVAQGAASAEQDLARARGQIGFIDGLVAPLYHVMAQKLPAAAAFRQRMLHNRHRYASLTMGITTAPPQLAPPEQPPAPYGAPPAAGSPGGVLAASAGRQRRLSIGSAGGGREGSSPTRKGKAAAADGAGGPPVLWLLDRHPTSRQMLCRLLIGAGYVVRCLPEEIDGWADEAAGEEEWGEMLGPAFASSSGGAGAAGNLQQSQSPEAMRAATGGGDGGPNSPKGGGWARRPVALVVHLEWAEVGTVVGVLRKRQGEAHRLAAAMQQLCVPLPPIVKLGRGGLPKGALIGKTMMLGLHSILPLPLQPPALLRALTLCAFASPTARTAIDAPSSRDAADHAKVVTQLPILHLPALAQQAAGSEAAALELAAGVVELLADVLPATRDRIDTLLAREEAEAADAAARHDDSTEDGAGARARADALASLRTHVAAVAAAAGHGGAARLVEAATALANGLPATVDDLDAALDVEMALRQVDADEEAAAEEANGGSFATRGAVSFRDRKDDPSSQLELLFSQVEGEAQTGQSALVQLCQHGWPEGAPFVQKWTPCDAARDTASFRSRRRNRCRLLDHVTVKGSSQPVRLYTYDYASAVPADLDYDLYKRQFEDALTKIEKGQWEHARRLLEWCEERWPDDEPRKVLHAFIERDGFTAPAGWPGYRPLTEK